VIGFKPTSASPMLVNDRAGTRGDHHPSSMRNELIALQRFPLC